MPGCRLTHGHLLVWRLPSAGRGACSELCGWWWSPGLGDGRVHAGLAALLPLLPGAQGRGGMTPEQGSLVGLRGLRRFRAQNAF